MKIYCKGYGKNKQVLLSYKKPNLKIKVRAKNYYNFTCFLRKIVEFLDKNKFIFLTLLWMILIFSFSGQPAKDSALLSGTINNKFSMIPILGELFKIIPIRKFAHFILYFCLSIFVSLALCDYEQKYIYIKSILICFLYACSDEIHQLFITGRSGMFSDVLIDTMGAIISMIFIYLFCKLHYNLFYKRRQI